MQYVPEQDSYWSKIKLLHSATQYWEIVFFLLCWYYNPNWNIVDSQHLIYRTQKHYFCFLFRKWWGQHDDTLMTRDVERLPNYKCYQQNRKSNRATSCIVLLCGRIIHRFVMEGFNAMVSAISNIQSATWSIFATCQSTEIFCQIVNSSHWLKLEGHITPMAP